MSDNEDTAMAQVNDGISGIKKLVPDDFEERLLLKHPHYIPVAQAYHRVFDTLDREKNYRLRCIMEYFHDCGDAYNTIKWKKDGVSANELIMSVGFWAMKALELHKHLAFEYKTSDTGMNDIMQKTSEWLINCGWRGLPVIVDGDTIHHKTAAGVYSDMKRYAKLRADLEKAIENAEAKAKPVPSASADIKEVISW